MSMNTAKVVWFELPVEDTERARLLYGPLMGWEFERFDGSDYLLTYEGGGAIHPANGRRGTLVYFGTDDVAGSVGRVRELGGSANEPREIPGVGRYAECSDRDGNAFGFFEPIGVVAA
jgi:uncharacterized protein